MKGEVMSQPEIRFYIELPVDEEGNTAYGFAVFAGYVEDGRLLRITGPAESRHMGSRVHYSGFAEVPGPARMLTVAEYGAIIAGLRDR